MTFRKIVYSKLLFSILCKRLSCELSEHTAKYKNPHLPSACNWNRRIVSKLEVLNSDKWEEKTILREMFM